MQLNSLYPKGVSSQEKISSICRNEFQEFFVYPNVVGVGFGYKEIGDEITDIQCIKVMVKEKVNSLTDENSVPKFYKGIPTDVIETGEFKACGFTAKLRPMKCGYGIGNYQYNTLGTAGCLVTTVSNGVVTPYILGTNHVMAGLNTAIKNDPIIQPSRISGGTPDDHVAKLTDFRVISFDLTKTNDVDAAIAEIDSFNVITPEIAFLPIPKGIAEATAGQIVHKTGATGGYEEGTVRTTGATVKVDYSGGKVANFVNQIITTSIGTVGDSGSAVLTKDNRVIGMLIATSGMNSIVTPIKEILISFNVDLYTQIS